jgi:predicted transcriptional regulator
MKYRSRTELASNILEAANGGATKTKIMYKAFLSYAQLKEYLNFLAANGLIDYDTSSQTFRTSEKGHKFLGLYNQMDELALMTQKAE